MSHDSEYQTDLCRDEPRSRTTTMWVSAVVWSWTMTSHATLDPRAARPLTSREISKVLCGIIGGVATYDPAVAGHIPRVLESLLGNGGIRDVDAIATELLDCDGPTTPSWAAALGATVHSLRGWCAPADVATALAWVARNLDHVMTPSVRCTN